MSDGPIGSVIDGLGVTMRIEDDDLVSDVMVIAKVVDGNGNVRLSTAWSDGMSWIERLGMLAATQSVETPPAGEWRATGEGQQ